MSERRPDQSDERADALSVRSGLHGKRPLTRLHIGDQQTVVAVEHGNSPESTIALAIGSDITSAAFFRHQPPIPLELENAIMAVEDEIARARPHVRDDSVLVTRDSALRAIAWIAGLPDQPTLTLSIERVEETFDRLAAVSLGRPAAHEGLPDSVAFAATLLILREFMHHMNFASLTIES